MKGGNRNKVVLNTRCGSRDEPRLQSHSSPKQVDVVCAFHHNLSPMGFYCVISVKVLFFFLFFDD